jgi:hypothetical protein
MPEPGPIERGSLPILDKPHDADYESIKALHAGDAMLDRRERLLLGLFDVAELALAERAG